MANGQCLRKEVRPSCRGRQGFRAWNDLKFGRFNSIFAAMSLLASSKQLLTSYVKVTVTCKNFNDSTRLVFDSDEKKSGNLITACCAEYKMEKKKNCSHNSVRVKSRQLKKQHYIVGKECPFAITIKVFLFVCTWQTNTYQHVRCTFCNEKYETVDTFLIILPETSFPQKSEQREHQFKTS
jgi:hypothetical protein